jgi:hypothetical protein
MDAYRLAIEQARKELAEAQQKLKTFSLRVSQLESLVAQLEAITLNAQEALPPPNLFELTARMPEPAAGIHSKPEPPPLWRAIINALNGKKSGFTVPEAIAALERTGRHIASPNRSNIVRNTVIHNKAFGRLGSGRYYVLGYLTTGNEKEVPSEEKTS